MALKCDRLANLSPCQPSVKISLPFSYNYSPCLKVS